MRLVNLDLIVRSAARIERLAKIRHGSIKFQDKISSLSSAQRAELTSTTFTRGRSCMTQTKKRMARPSAWRCAG